jgi:ABC-2 type transport system ATP-binding protein
MVTLSVWDVHTEMKHGPMAESNAAIEIKGLTKSYGDAVVVDHVDLTIPAGEIFGLLGPNAAGKSTAIRMMTGIVSPDAGSIRVLGMDMLADAAAVKRRIGYVAQEFALYPELSVLENLEFYRSIYSRAGSSSTDELLERYDLLQFADKRAGKLSGGYKRRLSIACAVSHDPELIYLDEPTAGIDPVTRKELWDGFYELAAAGRTLFVTTHYMEEAERCHRLAFINHGRIIACDTPEGIKSSLSGMAVYSTRVPYSPDLSRALKAMVEVRVLNQFGEELRIVADDSVSPSVLDDCISRFGGISDGVVSVPVSIEDAFMTMTLETA